jgi:lysophospholipase L1-like esterase
MKWPRKKGSSEDPPSPPAWSAPVVHRPLRFWHLWRLILRLFLFGVSAAVTVVLCFYALTGISFLPSGPRDDDTSLSVSSLPEPSVNAAVKGDPVTSLWFGDSIVQGCCRTNPSSLNMAEMAAATLGWQKPQVQGFPGTGYVKTAKVKGVTLPAYDKNIGQYLAGSHYKVVIIAGGNNDAQGAFSPVAFRTAVRSTLQQVRTALPDARLVVVGPYSPNSTGFAPQRLIEREEAARAKATFIDGIAGGWFKGLSQVIAKDGYSPNDTGQAYLGIRMAMELKKLGLS